MTVTIKSACLILGMVAASFAVGFYFGFLSAL